jgi:hypothetical protein
MRAVTGAEGEGLGERHGRALAFPCFSEHVLPQLQTKHQDILSEDLASRTGSGSNLHGGIGNLVTPNVR